LKFLDYIGIGRVRWPNLLRLLRKTAWMTSGKWLRCLASCVRDLKFKSQQSRLKRNHWRSQKTWLGGVQNRKNLVTLV